MDELVRTMILNAPNVAVALAALYWLSKRMDRMFDMMERLVEKCYDAADLAAAAARRDQNDPPA